ncbi:vicianin hydrolase-like [Senna tora]|uniref:Vicianin hydrolase-like n=1 Tax=Senna tora TaxID=362788 RepID=A0A834TMD3_9FABA|nr:vicianin hydrolase-like [Senna tora]
MRVKLESAFFFFFLFFSLLATNIVAVGASSSGSIKPSHYTWNFNRTLFPSTFLFGAGSASYQVEGAANIDGKGPSTWDTFTHQYPERIADGSNGDVAVDFYHRYKSDIHLMKKIGLDSFRLSISWSRIFPKGKGKVNQLGVNFYNNLINELLANGIKPCVTLFHWDLPQALEDEYGGFLNRKIVNDYRDYADFCFKTFGDRVKNWVTFNEPYVFISNGYASGNFPPVRCSDYEGNCTAGNSATEPYIVGHHWLLSHAAAVRLYKDKYQASQKGEIGITLVTFWYYPKTNTTADIEARKRAIDFWFGWHANPLVYGDYPESMKSIVGDRLPKLTKEESKLVKGTYDFIGLNYYSTFYIEDAPPTTINQSLATDQQVAFVLPEGGATIDGAQGLHDLLVYIKDNYKNPTIYIHENGIGDTYNASTPVQEYIKDSARIRFHDSHFRTLLQAIKDGVDVKGYYLWSFLDHFEWTSGFTSKYGITYVDFNNNLKRTLKYSAYWYKKFLLK